MPLDRLIKAKKSVSGIFCRISSTSIQPCSPDQFEKNAPSCEAPVSSSSKGGSTTPDANEESPTIDTSSVCKGLMGSLRKQKLRSISSLRSLRSPTKTKQSNTTASQLADSPHTPKHRLSSSLVLNFEESLPDRPMFDLQRKDSITSSLRVHHSSPVPVPASDNQNLRSLVGSSLIPSGTVPLSPAPIQRIFELDQTGALSLPTSAPGYNTGPETMGRPASMKDALSDGLQRAADYFNESLVSYEELVLNDLLLDECLTKTVESDELPQKLACEELSCVHLTKDWSDDRVDSKQGSTLGSVTNAALDEANVNKTAEEHAKVILGKGYYARAYRRADGKFGLKIKLLASDPEDGDDNLRLDNESPFGSVGFHEDKLVSELGTIIRENRISSTVDGEIDEAFATGKLPAYMDVALGWANAENAHHTPTKMRKRDSTWGQHTGLYDGSGYGADSSSRPVTGVTETADVPHTCMHEAFMDRENEAPTIIRRLWDNTYSHRPDTDRPEQATGADTTIAVAQEHSDSHFED